MKSREHGNIWPVVSFAAGAFFVLVIVPLILQREKSAQMATVNPEVTIGDAGRDSSANPSVVLYRWPDSEVPRTAERLRDVTAVAVAAASCVTEGALKGRIPRDAGEIASIISQRQLIPNEWLTNEPAVFQMPHATVHLRYLPSDLAVEVVSMPKNRSDGPAILIRIPDRENVAVGPRYFESMQLDGIVYSNPFAPIAEIIALGWQPCVFKQSQIPNEQRVQLEQWLRSSLQK